MSHCGLDNTATNAKSLSLRELALHQIGSHLSLYKSMFIGSGGSVKKSEEEKCPSHKKIRTMMKPRRSSYMFSIEDIMVDSTSVLKVIMMIIIIMMIMMIMMMIIIMMMIMMMIMILMIMKDSRHPSHTHLDRGETHRVVNLNRQGEILKERSKQAITKSIFNLFNTESTPLSAIQ